MKLPEASKKLLRTIEACGELRADDPRLEKSAAEVGKMAAKLEERMLIYSESVHTDSGKHVRVMRSWETVRSNRGFELKKIDYQSAVNHFTDLENSMTEKYTGKINFPWQD